MVFIDRRSFRSRLKWREYTCSSARVPSLRGEVVRRRCSTVCSKAVQLSCATQTSIGLFRDSANWCARDSNARRSGGEFHGAPAPRFTPADDRSFVGTPIQSGLLDVLRRCVLL